MDIARIIAAIADSRIRITDHADEEAQADGLSFDEIFGSVLRGEVIEEYPDDWPYPSCLCTVTRSKANRCILFGRTTRKTHGWSL